MSKIDPGPVIQRVLHLKLNDKSRGGEKKEIDRWVAWRASPNGCPGGYILKNSDEMKWT
jgi:hypothetical protein